MLDWINVMAYDGDKGAGHSPYSYTVNGGEYWSITRGVDKGRVVMGVPFYARPSGISYAAIIAKDKCAAYKDVIEVCQTTNFYNGLITMADKTKWVCENAGGIMIWEITQDTVNKKLSLLNLIDATIREYYPYYKNN
jgi:GH18 family chitinase